MKKEAISSDEITFLKESNYIENVLDRDSLDQAIEAWKFVRKQKKLTLGVVLKTHKILMLNQPTQPDEKGYFRRCEVTIGGRYGLNWVKIPLATAAWVRLANTGTTEDDTKFHHIEYERIHPFVDGNGRTGRMFMNWERLKAGLPILIIHTGQEQLEYYRWFR